MAEDIHSKVAKYYSCYRVFNIHAISPDSTGPHHCSKDLAIFRDENG
jgi:hypothetical protein